MIERAFGWLGQQFSLGMAWYDRAPAWLQLVIAVLMVLFVLAILLLMQGEEFRRDCQWREFRKWQKDRERTKRIRLPRGML